MRNHDALDDEARERAALHAVGALPPEEAVAYERHVEACAACRAELAALARTASELALLAPQATPPAGLKQRLLARFRETPREGLRAVPTAPSAQAWKQWQDDAASAAGFTLIARDAGAWEQTAFEGVEARRLFVDAHNDRVTMLVRMAAGSSYPAHVHGGPEECYVLEGDLDVGDVVMRAGDYQRMERGATHAVQSTRNGCLLFLVSSLQDELLAASSS
jgi:anti-sigma factor ChrR (cupin superfamily)